MTFAEEKDQAPPEIADSEDSSQSYDETQESSGETFEDYRAWLYVLAGFVTYIDVS